MTRSLWIRSTDAKDFVDLILVCTVTTILVVRLFLVIAGYPQLGGEGLHIAHLLWGGLLMLVALVLALTLLTRAARWLAALLGGIGFGLFIDELGKFVTANNDYFFRPTYSIIYVLLIAFWLVTRQLFGGQTVTRTEALANALELVKEAGARELDQTELDRARALIGEADPDDPLVAEVRELVRHLAAVPKGAPGRLTVLVQRIRRWYFDLTTRRWFPWAIVGVFIALTWLNVYRVVDLSWIAIDAANDPGATLESVDDAVNGPQLGFSGWATLGASAVVVVLNVVGVVTLLRSSRLGAYRWFERGVLVNIFFVQVFDFADLQLLAFATLSFNLLLLVTLRLLIHAEQGRAPAPSEAPPRAAAAVEGL